MIKKIARQEFSALVAIIKKESLGKPWHEIYSGILDKLRDDDRADKIWELVSEADEGLAILRLILVAKQIADRNQQRADYKETLVALDEHIKKGIKALRDAEAIFGLLLQYSQLEPDIGFAEERTKFFDALTWAEKQAKKLSAAGWSAYSEEPHVDGAHAKTIKSVTFMTLMSAAMKRLLGAFRDSEVSILTEVLFEVDATTDTVRDARRRSGGKISGRIPPEFFSE